MIKELKDFLFKGNVLDLAVAVIIGAAFKTIIDSLVADIIMPIIGLIFGTTNFAQDLKFMGIAYGSFLNAVINFLIIGTVLFFIVKAAEKAMSVTKTAEDVEDIAESIDAQEQLLTEIRDILANK